MYEKYHKLIGIVIFILFQSYVFGANYYVSPNGSDSNPGTIEHPWRTINYGISKVKGGVLYIREGVYTIKDKTNVNSGTADNPTVIRAYEGEKVTITKGYFFISGRKYFTIQGLRLVYTPTTRAKYGIAVVNSENFKIEGNYIAETNNCGIYLSSDVKYDITHGCRNFVITKNELYHTNYTNIEEALSVLYGSYGEISYNKIHHTLSKTNKLYIDIKTYSEYINVFGNEVWSNPGDEGTGIYLDGIGGYIRFINVYNNKLHDLGNGIRSAPEAYGNVRQNLDVKIYNNIIYNCMHGINIGWSALRLAGANIIKRHYVYNNTIYNCKYYGIYIRLARDPAVSTSLHAEDIYIYNNILVNNGLNTFGTQLDIKGDTYKAVKATNNLQMGPQSSIGLNPIFADPMFVDPERYNFHLKNDSPAIDKGTDRYIVPEKDYDGNPRPQNTKIDLGAFEVVKNNDNSNSQKEKEIFIMMPGKPGETVDLI